LGVRLGVVEFDGRDEETISNAIEVARQFKRQGVDELDVSMGFTTLDMSVPWGTPAFMAPIAGRFRREVGLPVSSSWGLDVPELAERAVAEGTVDLVMIARGHLANPFWTYYAARKLGLEKPSWTLPAPYAHWLERYAVGA
jgi:2,4-dienoyl-CoA reductase-like NADH-dependent reductase (Old Yellow Enzyme family)